MLESKIISLRPTVGCASTSRFEESRSETVKRTQERPQSSDGNPEGVEGESIHTPDDELRAHRSLTMLGPSNRKKPPGNERTAALHLDNDLLWQRGYFYNHDRVRDTRWLADRVGLGRHAITKRENNAIKALLGEKTSKQWLESRKQKLVDKTWVNQAHVGSLAIWCPENYVPPEEDFRSAVDNQPNAPPSLHPSGKKKDSKNPELDITPFETKLESDLDYRPTSKDEVEKSPVLTRRQAQNCSKNRQRDVAKAFNENDDSQDLEEQPEADSSPSKNSRLPPDPSIFLGLGRTTNYEDGSFQLIDMDERMEHWMSDDYREKMEWWKES